ncbi:MAG: KAP family NTPase, partial [Kangiellaceae bacterium]|nr:KAP family NTPase [Kangiellaceae bacterium]
MRAGTPLVLLGDGPQTVDLLGYQPYVDAMAGVLAGEQLETPFCIGIFGQWGTGKSTFMALLNQQLDKSAGGNFNTLFFQPWQFEEKEEVWKALLLSTLRYLEVELERGRSQIEQEYSRVKQTLSELIVGVGKLALDKAVKSISSNLVSTDEIFEAYARTSRDNSQFINTFREEFKNIKDEILNAQGNSQGRLFIFVDDLDRCTPENCMMVLESIKLFFDLEECVFVLGIDREVVQKGIEHKYKRSINIKGQDYLDKMIQLPFSLPPVSKATFENFIQHTTERLDFSESINQLIQIASESNPRRVKRISNCLQLVREVAVELLSRNASPELSGEPDEAKLALLLT